MTEIGKDKNKDIVMQKMRTISRALLVFLVLGQAWICRAQAPSKQEANPRTPGKSTVQKPKGGASVELASVSANALQPYRDQTIQAQGIIDNYINGNKNRYRFAMDDGSVVEVLGEFPPMGGTRWNLKARVLFSAEKAQLVEVSKSPINGSAAKGPDPLLFVGGGLILAALVTLGILSIRSKSEQQRRQQETLLAEERRRTEDAERRVREAEQRKAPFVGGGPGSTSILGGAPLATGSPHTMISVGHLEATSGPYVGTKFPLAPGENRLGRERTQNPQILLDKDSEVSGSHGSLIVRGDNSMLFRDASRNGSYVNGKIVHHGECPLNNGDRLEIGGSSFAVTLRTSMSARPVEAVSPPHAPSNRNSPTVTIPAPQAAAPAPTPRAAATAIGFGAEFEVISGDQSGKRFAITRAETRIGRESTDILLSDDTVSRSHAVLRVKDGRFYLVDLGSTHGTKVNGEKLIANQEHELRGSEQIELGQSTTLLLHRLG